MSLFKRTVFLGDPTYITFPDPGGMMRHWRASGAAPRGREGCGTSIAMIIRRVRRRAMICEPSRHSASPLTSSRRSRPLRPAPTSRYLPGSQNPKILRFLKIHDFFEKSQILHFFKFGLPDVFDHSGRVCRPGIDPWDHTSTTLLLGACCSGRRSRLTDEQKGRGRQKSN